MWSNFKSSAPVVIPAIGETERNVAKCLKEHQCSSSSVGHHMEFNTHSHKDDVTKLHQEPGWFHQGVANVIHMQCQNPNLNQDQGRRNLCEQSAVINVNSSNSTYIPCCRIGRCTIFSLLASPPPRTSPRNCVSHKTWVNNSCIME